MSQVLVLLREPAPPDAVDQASMLVQQRFGGEVSRIRTRLSKPGVIARFGSVERAERFASLLKGAGLQVEVEPEAGEFAWDVGVRETSEPSKAADLAQPTSPVVRARRPGARTALVGATVCLVLGGLVAYYAPVLLLVFGPLFLAAFVLSIVGIAQGNTTGGVLLLLATLIVGPVLSIGGLARLILPGLDASTTATPLSTTGAPTEDPPLTTDEAPGSTPPALQNLGSDPRAHAQGSYAQLIEIYESEARRIDTFLDEDVAAVRFKLRNNGDRTITRLYVTAYFHDAEDRVIFEDDFLVVSENAFTTDTLDLMRPGYIYQMEPGRYFTSPKVPDEWEEGNVFLQIGAFALE